MATVFQLKDKIAIITGGGTGIGASIAREFARVGAKVVLASRKVENLQNIATEIKTIGGEVLVVQTDVRVPEQVDNMVKQTVDKFGRVDILVNNAGGGPFSPGKMEEVSIKEWNDVITLNLTGTFLCSIAAGKVMIEQKNGKIINISSGAGTVGNPTMAHYAAAKAGVINLTQSLAAGWAQHNINVNCITPGVIVTEGTKRLGMVPPGQTADGIPVPRLQFPPDPKDVADLAAFLASAAADHITGDIIPIQRR